MKKGKKKRNVMMILMIICVVLSLTMLAIVAYDKLIKSPCSCSEMVAECWNK